MCIRDRAYDPASNSWSAIRDLPFSCRAATAVAYDDRYLLIMGPYIASAEEVKVHGQDYGTSAAALLYDTRQDSYAPLEPMPRAVCEVAFVRRGDRVYGMGGEQLYKIRSPYLFIGQVRATP